MAGYQNKNGFSGSELDNILYDHNWKAVPKPISFALGGYTGTEAEGIYPTSGEGTVDNLGVLEPKGKYQELDIVLTFSFLGKTIYAQIQSKIDLPEDVIYLVPFIGQDTSSNYHQYLLKLRQRKASASEATATYFQVKAVTPL